MDGLSSGGIRPDLGVGKSVKELLGSAYVSNMQAAFPDVDPALRPFGYMILCQLRMPRHQVGSIIIPDTEKDTERFRMQAALVRAIGPSAFRRRDTGEPWPEGAWCKPGSFVRCPMYGGDRLDLTLKVNGKDELVRFAFFRDTDLIAEVTGDVLAMPVS